MDTSWAGLSRTKGAQARGCTGTNRPVDKKCPLTAGDCRRSTGQVAIDLSGLTAR